LKVLRGLDVVHVPFQGFGAAITSTIAGHTAILWGGSISIIAPHVKEGTLRTLMTSGPRRSPQLPDTPTKEEAGVPDYGSGFWGGVMVPAGTPREIITFLQTQIARVMQHPDVKKRFDTLGFDPVGSTPDEFAAWLKQEYTEYGDVVRQANLKVE
jgi:tripartite-type tricarboxylate transporter receptor subunit TctC